MRGVPATVLAENVPKTRVVQERPYLRVVGALEVVARLTRPTRLEQDLEVLLRVTRDPRRVERVAEQRAPTARRRADEVRRLRHHRARPPHPNFGSTHALPPLVIQPGE